MSTTTTDWRELALDLANVASELATVANVAADGAGGDPWVCGMLRNNAAGVVEIVERVREAAQ